MAAFNEIATNIPVDAIEAIAAPFPTAAIVLSIPITK